MKVLTNVVIHWDYLVYTFFVASILAILLSIVEFTIAKKNVELFKEGKYDEVLKRSKLIMYRPKYYSLRNHVVLYRAYSYLHKEEYNNFFTELKGVTNKNLQYRKYYWLTFTYFYLDNQEKAKENYNKFIKSKDKVKKKNLDEYGHLNKYLSSIILYHNQNIREAIEGIKEAELNRQFPIEKEYYGNLLKIITNILTTNHDKYD
ncbi:hypothetical protein [Haploplasma modicum]|uniref:hypothetical protein n=1 Tax=Haploplasma modicum TaxID=2150 RepID=UPI00047B4094|nr:hypothetical protein [Haploplasma modicum]